MSRHLDVAGAVAWRAIHHFTHNPAFLIPSILFPLFFLTAFAGGLSSVGDVPGFDYPSGYTAFQFAFVLLQASAFGGVFTGFAIAADFEGGFSRRLMLAAPARPAILAGYALAALARATAVGSMVFVVALLAGMDVGGSVADLVGLAGLALGTALVATLFGAGVAFRLRTIQAGPLMQMPVFILLFLAPVYVPRDLLAGWIRDAASVNPVTPMIEAARDLLAGLPADAGVTLAVLAGMVAVLGAYALRGLRRAEREAA